MAPKSSKRILEVSIVFLMILVFTQVGLPKVLANEAIIHHQTKLQIENVSCNDLSRIKALLTNLDHNSRIRIVDYPQTFEVTHHSSIHNDTLTTVLSSAGYPIKTLSTQKTIDSSIQNLKVKGGTINQIHLPRRQCNATSASWKKLIRRYHHEWFTKSRS